jgi:Zn-dependent peptidase ImmA (M78 family)/transcriptional regulator with XRE-family HTH domain
VITGERIRQARELLSMTQSALAEAMDVSQPAIAQMEAGLIQPSDAALQSLSFATGFPVSFFRLPPPPDFPLGTLMYRARANVSAKEKSQTARLGQLTLELLQRLGQSVRLPSLRVPQISDERPAEAAEIARGAMGLAPDTPIPNLVRTLERSGALVLALPSSLDLPKQDAFSAWTADPQPRPLMVLAHREHAGRLRFNVAHELGHLVMHQSPRGSVATIEDEADKFASSFLMPADALCSEIERPVTLTGLMQLRDRWGVSVQALIHRARDLDLLSERQATDLYHQATVRGWRNEDPSGRAPEQPRALRKMVEMVYGDAEPARRLADDMAWPLPLTTTLLAAYAGEPTTPAPDSTAPGKVVRFRQRPDDAPRRADVPKKKGS